jgi:hypothetical protein
MALGRKIKEMMLDSCLAAAGMKSPVIKLLMKIEKEKKDRVEVCLTAMECRLSEIKHLMKI